MKKLKIVKRTLAVVVSAFLISGSLMAFPYGSTNITVAKAEAEINILDYESHADATEFIIDDIAGMEKLAELVNTGTDNFSDKKVTLKKDLKYDKSVTNNYTVIGDTMIGEYGNEKNCFRGTFDGGNHTISGINIKSADRQVGLFGMLYGNVRGIRLDDSLIESVGGIWVGGIAGFLELGGDIKKCIILSNTTILANVEGERGECAGGIAGVANGIISQCVNYGLIKGECNFMGGITGKLYGYYDGMGIYECCNFGNVVQQVSARNNYCIGGIVGENTVNIVNCFNSGKLIISSGEQVYAGGIVGKSESESELTSELTGDHIRSIGNCYNVGQIYQGNYYAAITCCIDVYRGKYAPIVKHCYWLDGSSSDGVNTERLQGNLTCDTSTVYKYSQSQMKSEDFVEELNRYSVEQGFGEVWAKDTENINNGYPILKNISYYSDAAGSDSPADPSDTNTYPHMYADYTHSTPITDWTVTAYANGATVTNDGVKKNHRNFVLYTDVLASYKYTINSKGDLVTATGKVIVGITGSPEKPVLNKGKIVDSDAAKIAKASIKNGMITITAGTLPGKVYLWVMDTGDAGTCAYCPVNIKAAPTTLSTYAVSPNSSGFVYGKTKKYTSAKINISDSTKVYLYPTYNLDKKTVKYAGGATYSAEVDSKAAKYFSVTKSAVSSPYCFTIMAKALKDGKPVSGKITIKCNENGKKIVFTATACNYAKDMRLSNLSNLKRGNDDFDLRIGTSKTGKTVGIMQITPVCVSDRDVTTDSLKIYPMGSETGFDAAKIAAGTVKITKPASKQQRKVTMSLGKDKKTITVTAAKGAGAGVNSYFLLVYNTQNINGKNGYKVVSVRTE